MNVYVLGSQHRSVLQARLPTIWGATEVRFHGDDSAEFAPEECAALVIAGATLPETSQHIDHVLRYAVATDWFSGSAAAISLSAKGDFTSEAWQRHLPTLDRLKLRTAPDPESARTFRQAGLRSPILTCADLDYLIPVTPSTGRSEKYSGTKPVLGVLEEDSKGMAETLGRLERDFEIRRITSHDLSGVDVCFTTSRRGVVLSVLHEIPFAAFEMDRGAVAECRALDYPAPGDVREAWAERASLRESIQRAKPRRRRLAERNIDLMRTAFGKAAADLPDPIRPGGRNLLVWAAPDEYWDEVCELLVNLGSGYDCLVPSNCRVSPGAARNRMPLPSGTLMNWAMLPEDLKQQLENRYDNTVVCHAFNGAVTPTHLSDLAAHTGRHRWEFRLWTHSCASYS